MSQIDKGEYGVFPPGVANTYRVIRTRLGPGEHEYTIPLNKNRGHAYVHSEGWAGVWYEHRNVERKLELLQVEFPQIEVTQLGTGEATFLFPFEGLDALLKRIGASKRKHPRLSKGERARRSTRMQDANRKAREDVNRNAEDSQDRRHDPTGPSGASGDPEPKQGRSTRFSRGEGQK